MTTAYLLLSCCIGALLGIMLFFAAAATPTAFRRLPPEHAGTYIRNIFPQYYAWSIVLAAAITALAWNVDGTVFLVALVITALFVFSLVVLVPVINRAREAKLAGEPGAQQRFKRLHLVSVLINLSQMVLLIVSVVLLAQAY